MLRRRNVEQDVIEKFRVEKVSMKYFIIISHIEHNTIPKHDVGVHVQRLINNSSTNNTLP